MTRRLIDIAGRDLAPVHTAERPALGWISVDDLFIDEAYQRTIEKRGWRNVEKIAANFDWAKFSPLMVSRRDDGRFAIIDGQHRAHAAALCAIDQVPALISQLTPAQEASAFSWINGAVTALTPNQVFNAALAALEPWAVQCDRVVSDAGCRLMPYNKSAATKKPGEVFTIGIVRRAVDLGQAVTLRAVLSGVRDSYVADDIRYYNGFGLNALLPAAVTLGVARSEVITAFLNDHDLSDTQRDVLRVMETPEFRGKSFKSLFAKSVLALMRQHLQQVAA